MTREQARRFRQHIDRVIEDISDETALDVTDLFLPWQTDTVYYRGDRRKHEGKLYRCEQDHISQADWTPDLTPALWTEISVEEWPEWKQPTGAQDAYRIGDKVSHNSLHWICTIDYNVYEPGVAGWEQA